MEKNIIDINVGSSPTNVKTINLKELNIDPLKVVSSTPINKQDPKWKDKFKPTLNKEGTVLTVQRLDSNSGWGQLLVLEGTLQERKGNKMLIIISSVILLLIVLFLVMKSLGFLSPLQKQQRRKK